jgi:hypothetical protein
VVAERGFTDSVNVRHHFLLYHKVTAGCPHRLAKKSLGIYRVQRVRPLGFISVGIGKNGQLGIFRNSEYRSVPLNGILFRFVR